MLAFNRVSLTHWVQLKSRKPAAECWQLSPSPAAENQPSVSRSTHLLCYTLLKRLPAVINGSGVGGRRELVVINSLCDAVVAHR